MPDPACPDHPESMIRCRVVWPPNSLVSGIEFWMCAHDGCRRVWSLEGEEMP